MDAPHALARRRLTRWTDARPTEPPLDADPAAQQRLLALQQLDSRLDRLSARRASLPELATLSEAAGEHQRVGDAAVRLGLEIDELERRRAQHEGDVAQVVARRDRDRHRMDTGQVGSPRELQDLQSEIEALDRRQSALEDLELEVMEELETAEARRRDLDEHLSAVAERGRAAQATRDATWAEIDAEVADVSAERAPLEASLPDDLRALYERLRAQLGGVGAAALRGGRCEGCRLQVDPADARRFAAAPPQEVLRCGECRRILVRPADAGAPPGAVAGAAG